MVDKPAFEVPQELRELTEKNIEQARIVYGEFMDFLMRMIVAWSNASPSNELQTSFIAVQQRSAAFAKENAERFLALASELANARDMQRVLALQSEYAQTQMQAYTYQAQELGWMMSEAMLSTRK